MRVGYHKLNQVVTPIIATIPDVISLLEQINISAGTWYLAIDMTNAFFFILVNNDASSPTLAVCQQYTFSALPQWCGHTNSSVLFYNLIFRNHDHLFLPQHITLVYYIDDIMLIEANEEEVAITLDLLIKHLCVRRGRGVNPTKMWEISTLVKFLGSPVVWGMLRYPF